MFAPTDDAFAALPDGLVDALLLPENEDALTADPHLPRARRRSAVVGRRRR